MTPENFMKNDKVPIKQILIIFIFSLFLRLLVIIVYPNISIPADTIHDYDPIATNVLAGNGFVRSIGHPDFIRGPGYPLFLSAIYLIFGRTFIAVKIIQSILDSTTIILTMFITYFLFNKWDRAYIAGIILALYPIMIYSSNLITPESLFCFTFVLSVFIYIMAVRTDKPLFFCISGMILAFTTMVRSTTILFPLIMGIWLGIWAGGKKKYAYYFMLLCLGFSVTLVPWTIRNYIVFHEFIPTVANGGNNFQAGSSFKYLVPLKERIQVKTHEKKEHEPEKIQNKKIISPSTWDAYMWRIGWENYKITWKRNPSDVAKLLFYKAARFWFATDSGRYQKIIFFIQIPFLILAITGLVAIIRSHSYHKELWLMVMSIAYFWGLFIVMFPLARYTVPILPFLSIFISGLVGKMET